MKEQLVRLASQAIRTVAPKVAVRIIVEHEWDEHIRNPGYTLSGAHEVACNDPDTRQRHRVGFDEGELRYFDGNLISPGSKNYALASRLYAHRREEIIQDDIQRMLEDHDL